MNFNKTHNCNEITKNNEEEKVELIGWCKSVRDHGGKKFIDLRDKQGVTQIVFDPDFTENFEKVEEFKKEYLIKIFGNVRNRPEGLENKKLKTGEVEVLVKSFFVISKSEILPFSIDEDKSDIEVNEELRLEYRYLDLRRESMKNTIINRSKFLKLLRDEFEKEEFVEIDTPILTKSTPEGARDFVVPSRKHKGHFFALPQSPQLFKQLLMVSGFEKYFQIATCFRDEDLRSDRQYEHKQLDLEVSFWEQEKLFDFVENFLKTSVKKIYNKELTGFKKLTYKEAMEKYGCDKPDLRITMPNLVDFTNEFKECGFSVFSNNIKKGGIVKGIKFIKGQDKFSRKDIDKLIEFAQKQLGAFGLAYMKVNETEIESSITKFFNDEDLKIIRNKFKAETGDLLFFISDSKNKTNSILDGVRRKLAYEFDLYNKENNELVWITNFPLFKYDNNNLDFEHNPFVMPNTQKEIDLIKNFNLENKNNKEKINELLQIESDCYDLVFNGVEISSGALRVYNPQLQNKLFEIVGFSKEKIENNFGWFLKAYNYGAPPHRGCAIGLDRVIMLLENKKSIRDVIPFPRNKHGFCPLTNSPNNIDLTQLEDLGIQIKKQEKKEN
jgi:aspartyl-tRNA synthetase